MAQRIPSSAAINAKYKVDDPTDVSLLVRFGGNELHRMFTFFSPDADEAEAKTHLARELQLTFEMFADAR